MTPNLALTICQIGIAGFSILAILCGYGTYHYSNKIDEERESKRKEFHISNFDKAEADRQNKHDEISQKIDEVILELKNYVVKGNKSLVENIPSTADWDMREGSVYLLVTVPSKADSDLMLRIDSKTTDAYLEFIITSKNTVRFVFFNPDLGELSKTAVILKSDFKDDQRNLVISFIWNLKEQKTNIYINKHERA